MVILFSPVMCLLPMFDLPLAEVSVTGLYMILLGSAGLNYLQSY